MAEPVELKYLNFAQSIRQTENYIFDAPVIVGITLSNRVYIQSRVVYDVFMMLGEVGGLHDFILLGLATLISPFS